MALRKLHSFNLYNERIESIARESEKETLFLVPPPPELSGHRSIWKKLKKLKKLKKIVVGPLNSSEKTAKCYSLTK